MERNTRPWLERAIIEYRQLIADNEAYMERWDISGEDFQGAFEHGEYLQRMLAKVERRLRRA